MKSKQERRRVRERAKVLEYWTISAIVVGGFCYGLWGGVRTLWG